MLLVWPQFDWISDSAFFLLFLALGTVITALVYRYAVRRATREKDHGDDE